eukprot:jgi/Botrbrau1/1778/Bobra.0217s0033.1
MIRSNLPSSVTVFHGTSRSHPNRSRRPLLVRAMAASAVPSVLTWDELLKRNQTNLDGYTLLGKNQPSTAATPTLKTAETSTTSKPVLLYRDTNAWCPFCERVWLALEEKKIPFDTVLINLRDKPDWYVKKVPTKLVPAAFINGELVYESLDILKKLEEAFPEPALQPAEPALKAELDEVIGLADSLGRAGYRYMAGRDLSTAEGRDSSSPPDPSKIEEFRTAFLAELRKAEEQLGRHEGPFFLKEFSLAECVIVPALERFAANLPIARGFVLRGNPDFPNLTRWYEAMDARPTYRRVKSDDTTHNLVVRKIFNMTLGHVEQPSDPTVVEARMEAAAKITANHEVIVDDILENSGIVRSRTSLYGGTIFAVNGYPPSPSPAVVKAVDYSLRRIASYLLTGDAGSPYPEKEGNAVGSAAVAFFRNRASSPRDLSGPACAELRNACDEVLKNMY